MLKDRNLPSNRHPCINIEAFFIVSEVSYCLDVACEAMGGNNSVEGISATLRLANNKLNFECLMWCRKWIL